MWNRVLDLVFRTNKREGMIDMRQDEEFEEDDIEESAMRGFFYMFAFGLVFGIAALILIS